MNSPSGSVLAADQILNVVNEFKKVSNKPVYTLWGHLLLQVDIMLRLDMIIFANGASITGSIGVMSGFLNFHDFDKKFGIQSESLSTGKYMDTYSEHQTFTNDKKAMVSHHQQKSYRRFLSLVQESR